MRYAVKKSGKAVGYCALSIRCGTRDEEGFHPGIAHFVEHTLFKGTKKRNARAINSCLDKLGGELNAYTTKEEIVLHATVLKEDLNKAASLLFELATQATFPENEIETEKCVVIDEINSYKDTPSEDIYDKFEEQLFSGHPLSRPILGTVASVKRITREELLKFVREKFTPQEMAFTVVADIDEEKMEKSLLSLSEKFFGKDCGCATNNAGPSGHGYFRPEAPMFSKKVSKRNHQANCIIGTTAPSLYEEHRRLTTILLCNILGGPASNSILNSILREKYGWVYGVECTYTQYADSGIVTISLGCDKDNLEKCIRAIDKELLKIKTRAFSDKALNAAKKQLFGQLAISSDNGETQCLSMGKSLMTYGHIPDDGQTKEKIEAITSGNIMEMANELFDGGRLSTLIFV